MIKDQIGFADPCGIVCEDFRQWVIEDNFVAGRPDWDKAGAMFVSDVLPYEEMKLRMLNGSHSFLAYNGSWPDMSLSISAWKTTLLKPPYII